MNLKLIFLKFSLFFGIVVFAQQESNYFYATMETKHANELKREFPNQIDILSHQSDLASVYFDEEISHALHQRILSHGPGYIQHQNREESEQFLKRISLIPRQALSHTVTEQTFVRPLLDQVNEELIEALILDLEYLGTRYHTMDQANEAAEMVKERWESFIRANNRQNDVSVRLVEHVNTPMKSVILTIQGNELPSEYVIIGAHLDSTVLGENQIFAPGADDNASGISTVTEVARVLLANNYKPRRTVEIMAYAAEEIGLVGSNEIATNYANQGKNVVGFVQFDMTANKGSQQDVYLATDYFIDNGLNLFLIELMEEYNQTGNHSFTYGTTRCNYGCSDHYSWAMNGYPAAFPFESSFEQSNPLIHSIYDTYENLGFTASHSAKFAKLGIEYIVEAAKRSEVLNIIDVNETRAKFYINKRTLGFELSTVEQINSASIINVAGQKVISQSHLKSKDTMDLKSLSKGSYILILETNSGKKITHKFLIQ